MTKDDFYQWLRNHQSNGRLTDQEVQTAEAMLQYMPPEKLQEYLSVMKKLNQGTTGDVLTHQAFFDWLRSAQTDGRLTQDEVDAANALLSFYEPEVLKNSLLILLNDAPTIESKNRPDHKGLQLSQKGSDMIKQFEAFISKPYRDAVGIWTIGYGSTYYEDRRKVSPNDAPITEERASELKRNIINMDFAPSVNLMFAHEIASGFVGQNQFDALISLAYNIGIKGLASSSVARYIKAGNKKAAADAFLAWNKARVGGKLQELKGLTRRRNAERTMFLA